MKIQPYALTILIAFAPSARAADPQADFNARTERLKAEQAATTQLFDRLKTQVGFQSSPFGTTPKEEEGMQPLFKVHAEASTRLIPIGKLIFGELYNRLIVGADGSPSLILIEEAQGSLSKLRVFGTARQSGTEGRVSIEITKLLLRNGMSIPIKATALDASGGYGLDAQVFSSKALAIGGAMASSFISGLAAGSQSQVATPFGVTETAPTGRNAMLQGVAQSAADQSKRFIDEATTEKPILVVDAGTLVTILVEEEARF